MADVQAERDEAGGDARRVTALLEAGRAVEVAARLVEMHPVDVTHLSKQIGRGDRVALLRLAPDVIDGKVLMELDASIREAAMGALPRAALMQAVRAQDSDDILGDPDLPQPDVILEALDVVECVAVRQALSFPKHSAGCRMPRDAGTGGVGRGLGLGHF